MKTPHALIIGFAIVLGLALHAFMHRYEHSIIKAGEGSSYAIVSRADKLTGEVNVYVRKVEIGFNRFVID